MKNKSGIIFGVLLCCSGLTPAIAQTTAAESGDSIVIPVGSQARSEALPQRGLSQQSVVAAFGDPQQKFPAVGTPPISRWEYPGFTVYFEGDIVIHSVAAHQTANGIQ